MQAQPRVVLAQAVFDRYLLRHLKADAVALVIPDGAVAHANIIGLEEINAHAPATVHILGFGLVAVDGESLDGGIFDVPAADHGKSQATNGLARYEIIEVKRRGDLEGPLVNASSQSSRGDFES